LAQQLLYEMAASDARGPQFERTRRITSGWAEQASTGYCRRRTSTADQRGHSGRPVIGHGTTPPPRAALFVRALLCLPCVLSSQARACPGEFCTCSEAGKWVCLNLPIERLTPSPGPVRTGAKRGFALLRIVITFGSATRRFGLAMQPSEACMNGECHYESVVESRRYAQAR
jgi:hypothetical protein